MHVYTRPLFSQACLVTMKQAVELSFLLELYLMSASDYWS